jgi:hypothetical protein
LENIPEPEDSAIQETDPLLQKLVTIMLVIILVIHWVFDNALTLLMLMLVGIPMILYVCYRAGSIKTQADSSKRRLEREL